MGRSDTVRKVVLLISTNLPLAVGAVTICEVDTKVKRKFVSQQSVNPLTSNIKDQIRLSCPHTLVIKVLGRSY